VSRGPHAPAPTFERYELRRHIRSGGFADVFLYWDRALDRDVAVKVLATGTATDEAKVMARVSSHPYIVVSLPWAAPELSSDTAPDSLRSLLRAALAKDPAARPRTVEQFGRSLQAAEADLRLQQTPLDIKQATPAGPRPTDAHETRGRSVRVVDPDVPTDSRTRGRSRVAIDSIPTDLPAVPGPRAPLGDGGRLPGPPPLDDTFVPDAARDGDVPPDQGPSRLRWIAVVGGVALVIAAVAVVSLAGSDGGGGSSPGGGSGGPIADPSTTTVSSEPPTVRNLRIEQSGPDSARAAWAPSPASPGGWTVRRIDAGADPRPETVHEPALLIAGLVAGDHPCVKVVLADEPDASGSSVCLDHRIGASS